MYAATLLEPAPPDNFRSWGLIRVSIACSIAVAAVVTCAEEGVLGTVVVAAVSTADAIAGAIAFTVHYEAAATIGVGATSDATNSAVDLQQPSSC